MGTGFTNKKPQEKIDRGSLGEFHDLEELLSYLRGEISQNTITNKDIWEEFDNKIKKARYSPKSKNIYQLLDHLLYEEHRLEKLLDFFEHKLPNQLQNSQSDYQCNELIKLIEKYQMKIFECIFSSDSFFDENLEKIFVESCVK